MVTTPLPPMILIAVEFELGVDRDMLVTTPAGSVADCDPPDKLTVTAAVAQVGAGSVNDEAPTAILT